MLCIARYMSCAASKRVAQMIDAFEPQLVDEDEEVIRQGAAGDFIYIIDQGMFQVLIGSVLGVCACVCACACIARMLCMRVPVLVRACMRVRVLLAFVDHGMAHRCSSMVEWSCPRPVRPTAICRPAG